MNEYLTKSDLRLVVMIKAEEEDKSWEFSATSFISVTKLPK